jgi:hypothetical protein
LDGSPLGKEEGKEVGKLLEGSAVGPGVLGADVEGEELGVNEEGAELGNEVGIDSFLERRECTGGSLPIESI